MNKISAAITAVGSYVPDFVLTNRILETMVDTNDEWITTRTGIKERRILKEPGKGTSFLAIKAAEDLINKSGLDPKEIDLVLVATATPDMKAAATAPYTATEIGATNAFAFDLEAACSSFLYGMSVASAYIESVRYKKVLLIGADKNSSFINYEDRATCIIFGDGAGAVRSAVLAGAGLARLPGPPEPADAVDSEDDAALPRHAARPVHRGGQPGPGQRPLGPADTLHACAGLGAGAAGVAAAGADAHLAAASRPGQRPPAPGGAGAADDTRAAHPRGRRRCGLGLVVHWLRVRRAAGAFPVSRPAGTDGHARLHPDTGQQDI